MPKKSRNLTIPAVLGACIIAPAAAHAINITPTSDPSALSGTLFLNSGGLVISGTSFSGSFGQAGLYQNPQGTYGLPNAGIALSTGNVSEFGTGPSDGNAEISTEFGVPATDAQQALLGPITGQSSHNDVAQLDISFFAPANISTVTFFGVFGSEEFPEFVGSSFIDGFGLYVNGTNVAGANASDGSGNRPINIDHPDFTGFPGTALNGVLAPNGNPVLRFDVPVISGDLNQFQVIVGDASDDALDTTVYLSSFFSEDSPPDGEGSGSNGSGLNEFDPVLPAGGGIDPETGEFVIDLPDVDAEQIVWVDPPVAVGYDYEITGNSFASILAPSLASVEDLDGYTVTVGGNSVSLGAGEFLNMVDQFGPGVSKFSVTGINPSLMLDPTDPTAFPFGVSFTEDTNSDQMTIKPITTGSPATVPLPAGLPLYLGAMALFAGFGVRRRQRRG